MVCDRTLQIQLRQSESDDAGEYPVVDGRFDLNISAVSTGGDAINFTHRREAAGTV